MLKYRLEKAETSEDGRKIWLTYVNQLGGAILLSHEGDEEPDWPALPSEFPLEQAKYVAKNGIMR